MKWNFPLDPECPDVVAFIQAIQEDPMSYECPCLDEVIEGWENKHRLQCERCKEFGVANVEVI